MNRSIWVHSIQYLKDALLDPTKEVLVYRPFILQIKNLVRDGWEIPRFSQ